MTVVVDASVALKWALEEVHTEDALALWDRWQAAGERVIAPPLFRSEVTNALHQRVRRGQLQVFDAANILGTLVAIVATDEPEGLYDRALSLASALDLSSTYDATYLALAEFEACEMWTADLRFVHSVQDRFRQVRAIGEQL